MRKEYYAIIIIVFAAGFFLRFWHYNVYVPSLYNTERITCLSKANLNETAEKIEQAKNNCLKIYPHFN